MKTFKSKIDLFDNVYGAEEAAEITASYISDDDAGDIGVYFTVIRHDGEDEVEIYDMKKGRRFTVIDGDFVSVCILLGLSLDPMALDPVGIIDDLIDPVDGDVFGSYTLIVGDGAWVGYDFDSDFEGTEKCKESIQESLDEVWAHYNEEPEMFTVYNG